MGNKSGKSKDDSSFNTNDIMDRSQTSQRAMVATWCRTDIPVTDVYEILENIGHGHMGEVCKVKRKQAMRGLHNDDTRNKNLPTSSSVSAGTSTKNPTSGSSLEEHFRKMEGKKEKKKKKKFSKSKSKGDSKSVQSQDPIISTTTPTPRPTSVPNPVLPNVNKPRPILRSSSFGDAQHLIQMSKLNPPNDDNENEYDDDNYHYNSSTHQTNTKQQSSSRHTNSDTDADADADADLASLSSKDASVSSSTHSYLQLFNKAPQINTKNTTTNNQGSNSSVITLPSLLAPKSNNKNTKNAKRRKASGVRFQRFYACKTLHTNNVTAQNLKELNHEIQIMRTLDHPYIIRLYEVYQFENKIWLIMDLCSGGSLASRKKMPELQCANITEQILRGVLYLHSCGILHRDLKLENILFEHSGPDSTIRLIDFGVSMTYDTGDFQHIVNPNGAYKTPPEIIAKKAPYTETSDVWSIGVIVWIILAGDYPFLKNDAELNEKDKREKLINAQYEFGITWRGRKISDHAKTFVSKCLKANPNDRWNAKEALDFVMQTWIPHLKAEPTTIDTIDTNTSGSNNKSPKKNKLDIDGLKKKEEGDNNKNSQLTTLNMDDIKRFTESSLLKKTILLTLANTMDRQEVGPLRDLFLLADTDHTGVISFEELKAAFRTLNPDLSDSDIHQIFNAMDNDQSGRIHYAEFVAALAEGQGLITMDRLADVFDRIDADGKGYISHKDLNDILGENYDKETVDRMIQEADFKKNGQIDFDELQQLMFDEDDQHTVSSLSVNKIISESLKSLEEMGLHHNSNR